MPESKGFEESKPEGDFIEKQDNEFDLDSVMSGSSWRGILYEIIENMDPWDIDISDLASRYAKKVEKMVKMDFNVPANVIIVCSVLLRMKTNFVRFTEQGSDDDADADFFDQYMDDEMPGDFYETPDMGYIRGFEIGGIRVPPFANALEHREILDLYSGSQEGPPRLVPRRVVRRKITAIELISALKEIMEDSDKKKRNNARRYQKIPRHLVIDDADEIQALIERIYNKISDILSSKKEAKFSEIIPAQTVDIKIKCFLSILHLSTKQKIKIRQDRLFGDIFIFK